MEIHSRLPSFLIIASSSLLSISRIHAADGTWLGNDGNWNATGTWSGGTIADGIGFTANFTGVDIAANRTITLAADRTIGNISFTDLTTASNNVAIIGANTLTLDVSTGVPLITVGNQTLTINSVIAGNEGLQKNGVGTLTLSNTANTYTGATNVTGGVLAVNGSLANTTTTVGTGATLQGSGGIGGSVTVEGGGTLAAGNSIESITTGALSLQAFSTFAYEINKDAAASVAGDLTAVTGNLTFDLTNAAILTLGELGSGSWTVGEKLTLISYSGAWNGGLFNYGGTLADDSTINFSGMGWLFNYNDTVAGTNYTGDLTGSRYVTMTAIPEPSVTTLLGGLGILALLRRRRK